MRTYYLSRMQDFLKAAYAMFDAVYLSFFKKDKKNKIEKHSLNTIKELDTIALESVSASKGGKRGHPTGGSLPNIRGVGNITVNLSVNISMINIVNSYIAGPLNITTFQGNLRS